jgi:hypothetical protein
MSDHLIGVAQITGRWDDVHVSKILVHPIKSCRGISVQQWNYTSAGLEYDRLWCITEPGTNKIFTARELPKLVLITPQIQVDETSPERGRLLVTFPQASGCATFSIPLQPSEDTLKSWELIEHFILFGAYDIDGYICGRSNQPNSESPSSILSKFLGRPVNLSYKGPRPRVCKPTQTFPALDATISYQDGYPLLFLSEESVAEVERQLRGYVGVQGVEERWREDNLVIERFRPNIILKGAGPFGEDMWEEIVISSPGDSGSDHANIGLVSKCTRCLLPNVSPDTGERDKAVPYKVIMKFRTGVDPIQKMKPCVGCNGVAFGKGVYRVGDQVKVKKLFQQM